MSAIVNVPKMTLKLSNTAMNFLEELRGEEFESFIDRFRGSAEIALDMDYPDLSEDDHMEILIKTLEEWYYEATKGI